VSFSRRARIRSAAATVPASVQLLANGSIDFRACLGAVAQHDDGTVSIAREIATALEVDAGDELWLTPPR
jgi:arginine/ornithine N-succinyltransferase beta subunit